MGDPCIVMGFGFDLCMVTINSYGIIACGGVDFNIDFVLNMGFCFILKVQPFFYTMIFGKEGKWIISNKLEIDFGREER